MSNPSQPYKLGNGGTVGGAAAKAGAEIGTAISEGVQAVAGVKKHRNALQHIAEQNQLGHERMIEAMSHAESLAAQAKADGRNTRVSATHSSIEYKSEAIKGSKNKKPPKSAPPKPPEPPTGPPKKTQLALAPGNPPRSALPQGKGPTKPSSGSSGAAPSNPEPIQIQATVRPMLALGPGKPETKPYVPKTRTVAGKKNQGKERTTPYTPRKRNTQRTVAGKKYGSSMPPIIESLDQSRETTNKNVDKAWAYLANKRKKEKMMASIPAKKGTN
jgi:hypothetical protein